MKELTLYDALDQIKEQGEKERQTVEAAIQVSEIIRRVTEARIRKGLTQRDLAEKCGLKQSAIARIETLSTIPRINTLVRIAGALDMEIRAEEKEATGGVSTRAPKMIYLWDPPQDNQMAYRFAAAQA